MNLKFNLQRFADTEIVPIAPALVKQAWALDTWESGLHRAFFDKFTGNSPENIIQIREELSKDDGDTINIPLLMPLTGEGVEGKKKLTYANLCAKLIVLNIQQHAETQANSVFRILIVSACLVKYLRRRLVMTELEQKLSAENERLRRELDELKRTLTVEVTPRVEYVDEKTRRFRGMIYKKHEATGYYMKTSSLHVDVYKFYNGLDEIPRNFLIHHDGKDANGNYDKEKNDIENLILMTRAAHTSLHNPELGRLETFICKNCGKVFQARKAGGNCYCSKECRESWKRLMKKADKNQETRTCAWCGKEFQAYKYGRKKYCSNHCGKLSQWAQIKAIASEDDPS